MPKVLFGSVERITRSGVGFEGVDTRVLFTPSCPGFTGLTGALDWSNRCEPFMDLSRVNCLIRVSLGCVVAGHFLAGLEMFY
jgi:hypothetical protein